MSIYSTGISFFKNFIKSFFDTDWAHWVTAISVMEEFKKGMMEGYPMQNGLYWKILWPCSHIHGVQKNWYFKMELWHCAKNYNYMNLVIQIEITACQSDIHDLPLIPVMGMITKSTKCVCPWPLTSIIYMTTD